MSNKKPCELCGTLVNPEFPLHICSPPGPEPTLDSAGHTYLRGQMHNCGISDCPANRQWAQDLEKTGHLSMLARVRAAHKMIMSMIDSFEEAQAAETRPSWAKGDKALYFYMDMVNKFDTEPLEEVVVSAKQWFFLYDLYQRSL